MIPLKFMDCFYGSPGLGGLGKNHMIVNWLGGIAPTKICRIDDNIPFQITSIASDPASPTSNLLLSLVSAEGFLLRRMRKKYSLCDGARRGRCQRGEEGASETRVGQDDV